MKKLNQFVASKYESIKNAIINIVMKLQEDKEKNIETIEKTVTQISEDLIIFDEYIRMNEMALMKIIKKYDKSLHRTVKPWILQKLEQEFFRKINLNVFIVPLSEVYECIELKKKGTKETSEWKPPTSFERSTTKYWVKYEDLMRLKIEIIKHLPVLIFKRKKFFDEGLDLKDLEGLSDWTVKTSDSSQITSIYFDDDNLFHYHERIQREEGSQLFRFRWYGTPKDENHIVFPERKTHHESWINEQSKKERVNIKLKNVENYIKGNLTIDKMVAKQVREGKMTKQDAEKSISLSKEIQTHLKEKKLKACVRTAYNRSAFQLSSSNAVRISIDTNLKLNNEDVAKKGWCLDKVDHILEFPYAIFEVKLQDTTPDWLKNLLENLEKSKAIIPVYKFSKFAQACAIFHKQKVKLLPHWMDEKHEELSELFKRIKSLEDQEKIEIKIEKVDEKEKETLEKEFIEKKNTSERPSIENSRKNTSEKVRKSSEQIRKSMSVNNEDEEGHDEGVYEKQGGEEKYSENTPLLGKPSNGWLKSTYEKITGLFSKGEQVKKFMPTKVEPKTFFANERTFMGWVSMAVSIQTMALLLVNFGQRIPGMILFPFCFLFMVYALYTYFWRMSNIQKRNSVAYHDKCGPPILVGVLLAAVIASYIVVFYGDWARRNFRVIDDKENCVKIGNAIPLASLSGITLKNNNIIASSSYELIVIPKGSMDSVQRISIPNFDITAISNDPSNDKNVFISHYKTNDILYFDLSSGNIIQRISLESTMDPKDYIEGITYDTKRGLLYATNGYGGIIGYKLSKNSTNIFRVDAINKIMPDVYLTDIRYLQSTTPEYFKISEITVSDDYLFILLSIARKLIILNLNQGNIVSMHDLPPNYEWKGISLFNRTTSLDLYLSSTYPAEVWKFKFDLITGFTSSCAWK